MSIYVTKPFLPPIEEFNRYTQDIFLRDILTNQGPCVVEFENKMKEFLSVKNFQYVTNGTIALQLALKVLDIDEGEIITTPFSYVATTSSILWERCKPIFVDIEPNNFTIDVNKIEAAITPKTKAIMPVHVFGYACDVDAIQKIAEKHNLKVIYDAAHAFGSSYKGRALASYGDVSTLSFHATKLFHTIEGGACICHNDIIDKKLDLIKRFGHLGDDYQYLGINGKQTEFNAAMGLAIYPYIKEIIEKRKKISELYDSFLGGYVQHPQKQKDLEYNYAYYPAVFESEKELLSVFSSLEQADIYPRRYFYPSLNKLPYLKDVSSCPISEDISARIACLPLYPDLSYEDVKKICNIILSTISRHRETAC